MKIEILVPFGLLRCTTNILHASFSNLLKEKYSLVATTTIRMILLLLLLLHSSMCNSMVLLQLLLLWATPESFRLIPLKLPKNRDRSHTFHSTSISYFIFTAAFPCLSQFSKQWDTRAVQSVTLCLLLYCRSRYFTSPIITTTEFSGSSIHTSVGRELDSTF